MIQHYTPKVLRMYQPFDQVIQFLEICYKKMLINVHSDGYYNIVYHSKTIYTTQMSYKELTK